jgi:AcrR family transcriptional regulator
MTEIDLDRVPEPPVRRRRSDGERSRQAILHEAAQLATVEGLEGLSLGRLADAVGMSKSGLFAHFGSKEELQLATIEAADVIFSELVVDPALSAATDLERLQQLAERFLQHVEDDVFPGGCFFASVAAEIDRHAPPVRDLALKTIGEWFGHLVAAAQGAQLEGQIDDDEDPVQLAFEIDAFLLLANVNYVVGRTPEPLDRARHAVRARLALAAPRMDATPDAAASLPTKN